MTNSIELGESSDGLTANLKLAGEFDISSVHAFHENVLQIDQREARSFVVDCSELNYIDVAGLQLLLTMKLDCESNNKSFELVEMPEPLTEAMNRVGFNKVLFIH